MNILFWATGFWPKIGGIETHLLRLIQGMQQLGHRCLVIAHRDHESLKEDDHYEGIDIKRIDFNKISKAFSERSLSFESFADSIMSRINHFKVDMVHLHLPASFLFLSLKKIFQCPIVSTIHFDIYSAYSRYDLIQKVYTHVEEICCVSQSVLEIVKMHLPSVFSKSQCIYNGLPFPELAPAPLPVDPPTILCLGRFVPEKGFDLAIKAFSQIKKEFYHLQLILAGDGPETSKLKKLVEDLNLSSSVTFRGFVIQENIPALLNQASFVLMPSHFEPFGLVALEAAQMERPVIATRVGGLEEVVLHQQTGILIPMHDISALCEAMRTLLSHPEMAIAMGKAGRKRAREIFSLENMVTSYESLYIKLLEKNKEKDRTSSRMDPASI